MSEFDKEAEREKLREQFARDEEKRKNTRRMSELLLKGATMTNQHCNQCGDPIFRHDGEEFCPSCGGAAAEQQAAVPDRDTEIETAEKQLDSPDVQAQTKAREQMEAQHPEPSETSAQADQPSHAASQSASQSSQPSPPSQPASAGSGRAELRQALSSAATNATNADDPHTAKAWLEAAREAAEALAALDR